jgi:hypothetical protein
MSVDFTNTNVQDANKQDILPPDELGAGDNLVNPLEREYIEDICGADGMAITKEASEMTINEAYEDETFANLPDLKISDLSDDEQFLSGKDEMLEDDIAQLDEIDGQYDSNLSSHQSEMVEIAKYNARAVDEKLQYKLKFERELEESRQQGVT